jgi:hypothetical protein
MRKTMKPINLSPTSTGCIADHRSSFALPVYRIQARLSLWYQSWQQHRAWKRDMDHVAQFSPYLLRDIGLTTDDVARPKQKKLYAIIDTIGRPG